MWDSMKFVLLSFCRKIEKMRSHPRRLLLAGVFFAVAGVVLFEVSSWLWFSLAPFNPKSTESVIIEVRRGQHPKEISQTLAASKVIRDASSFIWLGRVTRRWKDIKAGEYKVSPSMPPLRIFSILTSGISVAHPITVREGENLYEIASDLEAKGLASKAEFVRRCKDPVFISKLGLTPPPPTLEGYLYPDTYFLTRVMTLDETIQKMVRRFSMEWGENEDARARKLGLSRHEVVTLASIIEKETGAAKERSLISSVFHNRLKKGMRLQSDPTTIYGMWEAYDGNIRKKDLLAANPYNTYYVPRLPIGPISNPGKDSIQAALSPAITEFLFFVSHNDGTHEFTRTFEEHQQAVRRFQLDKKARDGKSWRDLKKSPPAPNT